MIDERRLPLPRATRQAKDSQVLAWAAPVHVPLVAIHGPESMQITIVAVDLGR
ncbi:MAG: hypothetical protein R3300_16100 [Candidatus Promineifilaceae bacterium]|nr:hypothetical protein [Candidatus Promineifilaceae bacterium]